MRTTLDNFDKAMSEILETFRNATDETVDKAIAETSKEAVQELKNAHPSGSGKYGSWKAYNASWTIKKNTVDQRNHRGATIHNAKYYRLTHLLEKGHALPQGGRSRSFPHIRPVDEKAEEALFRRIREGI